MTINYNVLQGFVKEGKLMEALRAAIALFGENTTNINTWYEIAAICLHLGETDAAEAGLKAAGREYAESGNLPMAVVCIKNLEEGGGEAAGLKRAVASLYGKGSTRLRNRAMPVPPLPSTVDDDKLLNLRLDKNFLVREAANLMTAADESAKMARSMRTEAPPVPYFPLFGSLSEENFIRLIDCFHARRFYKDDILITQGETAADFHLLARGEVNVLASEKSQDDTGRTLNVRFKHIATLGPGTFVGEMGIVARTPRSANVQATSGGILLTARLEDIERLSSEVHELAETIVAYCEVRLIENVMSSSPILAPIEDGAMRAEAMRMFDRLYVPAGDVIIGEGQPAKGIFIVVSGEVGVTKLGTSPAAKNMRDSQTAHMIYVTTLTSGDIVGEISTVMKKPATATVHAVTDAALMFLPKEKFLDFTKTYPGVFQRIYEIVTSREEEIEKILESKTTSWDERKDD